MPQEETLAVILGLDGDSNIRKYFYAGALKWARLQSKVLGLGELSFKDAATAALALAKEHYPTGGMVGAYRLSDKKLPDETKWLPAYHWPQIAWTELYDFYKVCYTSHHE